MKLPKGMKVVIGQRKYTGPCEIKDSIVPVKLKEKIEKKVAAEKKSLNEKMTESGHFKTENNKPTKVVKK